MTIKDFTVGQTAYMVSNSNEVFRIIELTVTKIGRVYLTAGTLWSRKFYVPEFGFDECLREKGTRGYQDLLFRTRQDAEDYLEKRSLCKELQKTFGSGGGYRYTLAQLRAVKQIIDGEESA